MVATAGLRYAASNDGYVFQSETAGSDCLLVTQTGTVTIVDFEKQTYKSNFQSIYGIIGVIHLYSNHYVLIADKATKTGSIYGNKDVFQVDNVSILPLDPKRKPDSDESKYLEMLKQHLNNSTLFFSYHYDLTKQFSKQNEDGIDIEYMWNYFVNKPIFKAWQLNATIKHFLFPVIYGYAKFKKTTINSRHVTFGLITRRSRFRAGTRYFRRGIDQDGYVANFNENEQILETHNTDGSDKVYSYLQSRGSVPVYWAEMNCLTYKPKLLLGPTDYLPTRKHFDRSITKYGTHYLVNLVNQSGYEQPVKLAYESAVNALNDSNIKYTYFDFHHECSKMRWDRVKLLLDYLSEHGLSQDDYTSVTIDNHFVAEKIQSHIVRTNCMDCLDRTNVVQSMFGRWYLQKQLIDAGIINGDRPWESIDPEFNFVFQNIWADNADFVSNSYSGTGALKTDYTRTGKRTKLGALSDLNNSITRYIKNNYFDGLRQDGYDLFLGNALPYETTESPFSDLRPSLYQNIPYFFFVSLAIMFTTIIFPKGSIWNRNNLIVIALTSLMSGGSLKFMLDNGIQFINWPSLVKLDFLIKEEVVKDGKLQGYLFKKANNFNKYSGSTKKE